MRGVIKWVGAVASVGALALGALLTLPAALLVVGLYFLFTYRVTVG